MANFHSDELVIVANEENMCKVLARMAMNLAANEEITEFSMSSIEGLESARELYLEIGRDIDCYYNLVFAGAPIPEDVAASSVAGWTSETSSAGGFMEQLAAIAAATQRFNPESDDGTLSLVSTSPVGRYLSDSASVSFTRYGENWALGLSYSTAWCPNSEDVDTFFMGLPRGEYGVAFYDSDEYDGYESISVYSGLHHGCSAMRVSDGEREDTVLDMDELKQRRRDYSGVAKAAVTDLAELASIVATCEWSEWGWDDEDNDENDWYDESDADESVHSWDRPAVNWRNPTEKDLKEIDSLIIEAIASFPWCHRTDGGYSASGNEAAEILCPGDTVEVISDWKSAGIPGKVILKVHTASGVLMGNMGYWMNLFHDWDNNDQSSAVLACLLPHIQTTVWEITPVSLRSKGVEGPNLSVRFDLEPVQISELLNEVHGLLEKSFDERALSSKGRSSHG